MQKQQETGPDDDERADIRAVVPVALAAGVIVGAIVGMGIELALHAHGWRAMVTVAGTTVGGGAVLVMVGRILQGIQRRAIGWRRLALHYEDVVQSMAADMEAAELRHVAELVRLQAEPDRARAELAEMKRQQAHALRKAEARGYVAGVRQRLAGEGRVVRPRSLRPGDMRPGDKPN